MIITRKVRINPSREVQLKLWDIAQLCTLVWNVALDQRLSNPSINVYEQKKCLPSLKKENPNLKKPCSQVLQNIFFQVDQAYKMYSTKKRQGDKKVKPPKHKKRQVFFTQEYPQKNISFKIESTSTGNALLKLAYGSRPSDWLVIIIDDFDYSHAKTVTIVFKNKKWYACITHTVNVPPLRTQGSVVYFDPGVLTALTGLKSDGSFYEYSIRPLYEINSETFKEIDRLKNKLGSKKKGSYHYRRLSMQVRALHSKIATRKKAYLHKLANTILDDHSDAMCFEIGDWQKQETLADTGNKYVDRKINRAVQNNHPLETLIGYLTYKGALCGQAVKRFDERGTSRTCVFCGYVCEKGITPSKRIFTCEKCLFTFPRDHHSCLNFVKKFNAALWQCLSETLPDRSIRMDLHPFLFKPRSNIQVIAAS